MKIIHGFAGNLALGGAARWLALLVALALLAACAPPTKSEEELRKDIQALKADMAALKEKVAKLEAGQQEILAQMKKAEAPPAPAPPMMRPMPPAPAPAPLTVSQLLKEKDRYIGARVTVRGPVGPVVVHHKSLMLKSPEGDVEVFFGNLSDKKLVDRLTSIPLDHPITVTGVVSAPMSKGAGAKLQITAEEVQL